MGDTGPMNSSRVAPGFRLSTLARAAGIPLAVAVVLAGCAAAGGPSGSDLELLRQESIPYQTRGTSSIAGRVELRTTTGELPARDGTHVYLTPVTTWARSRFQAQVLEKNELPDQPRAQVWWTVDTDANGNFRFINLPAGDYYVLSAVAWAPAGGAARTDVAFAVARVEAGQALAVTVTRDTRS